MPIATKMTDTYIFNPEHDLALAYGSEGYTAPPLARQMRRDLQMLPAWYCGNGADILSQNVDEDAAWIDDINRVMNLHATPVAVNRLQRRNSRYSPWGWNLDLRQRLLNACVPVTDLPSRDTVLKLQELSHRRNSIIMLDSLYDATGTSFVPAPVEVCSVNEIRRFNAYHPGCYIKAPWSGSGKGIYRVLDAGSRNFETWAQGIINRQGSIICEQPYNKVVDFAMEFLCKGGEARFVGYSVFNNDSHCSYDSGTVAQQSILEQFICANLQGNAWQLSIVRDACSMLLTRLVAPYYNGYMGIDMMIFNDNGTMCLNPCVEMNLRMTMGTVAIHLADRYVAPGSTATFKVTYHKSHDDLIKSVADESAAHPLQISDGKITSGFMPLTPIYPDALFLPCITASSLDTHI